MWRLILFAISLAVAVPAASADPIDDLIRGEMAARHIPGLTFAIVKDGAVIATRSYGSANLELDAPAGSETVYAIGSITKSMTAIVTLKLVEAGQVNLAESILTHIPAAPDAWKSVTVGHLLANTSGIPDMIDSPCGVQATVDYTTMDAVREAACLPLMFQPGERFNYSNTNFLLLSVLIERVTGQPLGEVFADTIFTPLGMSNTRMVDYRTIIPNRAKGYLWTGETHVNVADMDPAVEAGAGGVISTAGDMAKFILALGDTRLLTAKTWALSWTAPQVRTGATPYALGFGVSPYEGHARVGHNGAAPGFASSFAWFPEDRVGVILLANGYEEPHGRSVMSLTNAIAARYFD